MDQAGAAPVSRSMQSSNAGVVLDMEAGAVAGTPV